MPKLHARPISHVDDLDAMAACDASAAAVLSAYVHAEQLHFFRRLLGRRLALIGLIWIVLAAGSSFIAGTGMLTGLAVLSVGGGCALFLEWRAVKALRERLSGPPAQGSR